jgi:hypothetical protein
MINEIHENKKLAKFERELTILLEPVLRPLPAHAEFYSALQARLETGTDRIGDIVKEKVLIIHFHSFIVAKDICAGW